MRLIRTIKNRIRKFRRSGSYNTFLGVFWALVAFEALKVALVVFVL